MSDDKETLYLPSPFLLKRRKKKINVEHIGTKGKISDIFTKTLPPNNFSVF